MLGGSATVAVPPLTTVPPEELGGALPPELQAAATTATAAIPATAARRALRLHRFICSPYVVSRPACVMPLRFLLGRSADPSARGPARNIPGRLGPRPRATTVGFA